PRFAAGCLIVPRSANRRRSDATSRVFYGGALRNVRASYGISSFLVGSAPRCASGECSAARSAPPSEIDPAPYQIVSARRGQSSGEGREPVEIIGTTSSLPPP